MEMSNFDVNDDSLRTSYSRRAANLPLLTHKTGSLVNKYVGK